MTDYKIYLEIRGYSEKTVKSLLRIAREYGHYQRRQRDTANYTDYLSTRPHHHSKDKRLSKSTISHYIYGVKQYLHYQQISRKEQDQDQITQITLTPGYGKQPTDTTILSIEEVNELMDKASLRDRAVIACLYHLGLRVGEASNLTLTDIDLQEKLILIRKSKTGYQRQVPMSAGTAQIITEYLAIRQGKDDKLLQGQKGGLTPDGIAGILKRNAARQGIPGRIHPHCLRHSIATHLLHQGMELEKVSLFLGHRSIESTQRYTHISP